MNKLLTLAKRLEDMTQHQETHEWSISQPELQREAASCLRECEAILQDCEHLNPDLYKRIAALLAESG